MKNGTALFDWELEKKRMSESLLWISLSLIALFTVIGLEGGWKFFDSPEDTVKEFEAVIETVKDSNHFEEVYPFHSLEDWNFRNNKTEPILYRDSDGSLKFANIVKTMNGKFSIAYNETELKFFEGLKGK